MVVTFVVANVVWMAIDRSSPSWDQSNYLHVAWDYVLDVRQHGLSSIHYYVLHRDPGQGPFFTMSIGILLGFFGAHVNSALLLNLVEAVVALYAMAWLANRLGGRRAVLPAVVFLATMPVFYGLSRQVLVDLTLATFCILSLVASIKAEGLTNRRWTLLLGVFVAVAVLTKVTAPGQIAVGVIVGLFLGAKGHESVGRRARLVNAGLGLLIAALLTGWWYVPNLKATRAYIKDTTSGSLSLGAGPADPLRLSNIKVYLLQLVQIHLGWPVTIAGLAALVVLAIEFGVRVRRGSRPAKLSGATVLKVAFVAAWILPPIAIQAANTNQDGRLVAPALVGVPLAVGCLIGQIHWTAPRVALAGGFGLVCGVLAALHSFPGTVKVPVLPETISFSTPLGQGSQSFDNAPIGYAAPPARRDDAGDVTKWLLAQAADRHLKRPLVLGVLETHPQINGNTIGWLDVRQDHGVRITVEQPLAAGLTERQIEGEFSHYDVVAIVPDLPPVAGPEDRTGLLDEQLVTPGKAGTLLKAFDGTRAVFPVEAPGSEVILEWRGSES